MKMKEKIADAVAEYYQGKDFTREMWDTINDILQIVANIVEEEPMSKIEVSTITPNCYKNCVQLDIHKRPDGELVCSKRYICRAAANAVCWEIQERFEEEGARAFMDDTKGLKEHAVWNKAIAIVEEYIDDES